MEADPSNFTGDAYDPDTKYIVFRKEVITLHRHPDHLWYDDKTGTCFALTEPAYYTDPSVRVGVGLLALPVSNPLTGAAKCHDYSYSSPAFQCFHTRSEADDKLKNDAHLVAADTEWDYLANAIKIIARHEGGKYWEESTSRDK